MNHFEDQVSFHDSSIVGLSSGRNSLSLSLEDVSVQECQCSMTVTVNNIERLTRNDVVISELQMETEDGEVLRLGVEDDVTILVVIWHQYTPRSNDTHVYQMSGKEISLALDPA